MNEAATTEQPTRNAGGPLPVIALVLALVALAVSGYLSVQSILGNPVAGCGGEGGCAAVLASPWAKVLFIPVSLLGALTYLAIIAALGARLLSGRACRYGDAVLLACAAAMIGAAGWFTYIQFAQLDEWCKYCMTDHGIGLVLGLLLVAIVFKNGVAEPIAPAIPLAAGLLGVVIIAGLQTVFPSADARGVVNLPDRDYDFVENEQRRVGLFGGEVDLILEDELYKGDPRAEHVMALAFDYCCPHCREMHELVDEVQRERGDFVVISLPISVNEDHNEYINSTDERFDESYELARLAIAVASVDADKWRTLDTWLFSHETITTFPRSLAEAEAKATELIGADALAEALNAESLASHEAELARNIAMFGYIGSDDLRIPVTTAPGASEHRIERFWEAEEFDALFKESAAQLRALEAAELEDGVE